MKRTKQCWSDMKQRCYNQKAQQYKNYGARGIEVCPRWLESFDNFLEDMGEKPEGMSIDRINVNGNYEPSNCRWATNKVQQTNKRTCRIIEFNGVSMTKRDWANHLGMHEATITTRLNAGWPVEMILTTKRFRFGNTKAVTAMGEKHE